MKSVYIKIRANVNIILIPNIYYGIWARFVIALVPRFSIKVTENAHFMFKCMVLNTTEHFVSLRSKQLGVPDLYFISGCMLDMSGHSMDQLFP